MSVCTCGHVLNLHRPTCLGCICPKFTASDEPATATEAARSRQVEQTRLERVARRALSMRHYDEALGAVLALLEHDRKANR